MDVEGRGVKRGPESSAPSVIPEGPPGLQGDGAMLREILASVKSTEGRLGRLQADVSEAKEMAAKSLAQSSDTRDELEGIKNRLTKVEKGEGSASSGASQGSWDPWMKARAERDSVRAENNWGSGSRFDMIGGPRGVMAIMGGFPKWTRTDRLKEWFEELKLGMGPLAEEIKMMIPPGTRGHILQLELKEKESLRATRLNTLDFVKRFKALGLKIKAGDSEHVIWASPSKPENLRAQDRETTQAVQTLKELLKDNGDVETQIEINYTQGRVWWGDKLVVQREQNNGETQLQRRSLEMHQCNIVSGKTARNNGTNQEREGGGKGTGSDLATGICPSCKLSPLQGAPKRGKTLGRTSRRGVLLRVLRR